MTQQEIMTSIDIAWDAKSSKMDWLGLEKGMRAVLRLYNKDELDAKNALQLINDTLAAYTKRGSEFDAS